MTQQLENPIWTALTTRQEQFAEINGQVRRFPVEMTSLAAFPGPSHAAFEALAQMLKSGEGSALFLLREVDLPQTLCAIGVDPMLQMIHSAKSMQACEVEFNELSDRDVPEMTALAALTKPGPFGKRTRELGTYLGIRRDGKLVAMAGERLRIPGYTEVSAVCTHPDHTGKGYSRAVVTEVVERIRQRGEVPMLHVREANTRAIELYKGLGFAEGMTFQLTMVRKNYSGSAASHSTAARNS
ncbi:MAG: GNAT family N-acetyltransferase [Candidatus Acidiferrales bacterium]